METCLSSFLFKERRTKKDLDLFLLFSPPRTEREREREKEKEKEKEKKKAKEKEEAKESLLDDRNPL
jgi:phosphoribosylformylglycinamidine (FGAM) synthase-like enzyme